MQRYSDSQIVEYITDFWAHKCSDLRIWIRKFF